MGINHGWTFFPFILDLWKWPKMRHIVCVLFFLDKPCGLMDQTASAVGNLVTIDFFGKDVLTQIDEAEFYANIPALRKACGDRAVMR